MSIGAGLFPANTLIPVRASSPHDGLLQESPTPMLAWYIQATRLQNRTTTG